MKTVDRDLLVVGARVLTRGAGVGTIVCVDMNRPGYPIDVVFDSGAYITLSSHGLYYANGLLEQPTDIVAVLPDYTITANAEVGVTTSPAIKYNDGAKPGVFRLTPDEIDRLERTLARKTLGASVFYCQGFISALQARIENLPDIEPWVPQINAHIRLPEGFVQELDRAIDYKSSAAVGCMVSGVTAMLEYL
jgi:hypothetical protein